MADIKTLDCGCEVIVATNGSVMLTYCPLHKAAPNLHEALGKLIDFTENLLWRSGYKVQKTTVLNEAKQVLAKAEV